MWYNGSKTLIKGSLKTSSHDKDLREIACLVIILSKIKSILYIIKIELKLLERLHESTRGAAKVYQVK